MLVFHFIVVPLVSGDGDIERSDVHGAEGHVEARTGDWSICEGWEDIECKKIKQLDYEGDWSGWLQY